MKLILDMIAANFYRACTLKLTIILLGGLLISCSKHPVEPDVKAAIEFMSNTCNNCYSIAQYEQTDTLKTGNRYMISFSAVIEIRKKAYLVKDEYAPSEPVVDLQDIRLHRLSNKDTVLPVGARYGFDGTMYFFDNGIDWYQGGLVIDDFSKLSR